VRRLAASPYSPAQRELHGSRETGKSKVVDARVFGTTYVLPQLRLFTLGGASWLKALKLGGYAPPHLSGPMVLQGILSPT
jgi:hypothetical protein